MQAAADDNRASTLGAAADVSVDDGEFAGAGSDVDWRDPTVKPREGMRETGDPVEREPLGQIGASDAGAEWEERARMNAADAAEHVDGSDAGDEPEPVDLTPVSLQFTVGERRFLNRLLPLLDTSPRGIKRYINIYRLIKSVVGIDGADLPRRGSAPHECAMFLLALQTGLPIAGPALVHQLAAALGRAAPDAESQTLAGLLRDNPMPRSDSVEAHQELARLQEWLVDEDLDWPLASLANHARHVRLYNYG
jgi:hypothetical protein